MARHTGREGAHGGADDWRIERLRAAGFSPEAARRLAHDRRYDLHALLDLIDRGCTPELAARILAPLDLAEPPTAGVA